MQNAPDQPAGNCDGRLVGHHVHKRLIDPYLIARPDVPGTDFGFDHAFAQVR
jgi:hypothetical protein